MNFPNLHFIFFFFLILWVNIVEGNALSWPPHFFWGRSAQSARRRSRSQFGLGSAPPPAPLRTLGKTRNSVYPRMANCSEFIFLPFPLHIHADTVDDTSFQFVSPHLLAAELELCFCFSGRFSDSPWSVISVCKTVTVAVSKDNLAFSHHWKTPRQVAPLVNRISIRQGRVSMMQQQFAVKTLNLKINVSSNRTSFSLP